MSAPTDLDRLLAVLEEFGVPARLPGGGGHRRGYPVVVDLCDGTPLVLDLPDPGLLANLDPIQVGVAVLDGRGVVKLRWGLAFDLPAFRGDGSLLDTDLGSLILSAQRGAGGVVYLDGCRYFAAGLPGNPGDTLMLIVNAREEQLSRNLAKRNSRSAEALRRVGKTLNMHHTLTPLIPAAVHELASALELSAVLMWVYRGEDHPLELMGNVGVKREAMTLLQTLDADGGVGCAAELVASRRQEIAVRHVRENAVTAEFEAKFCYLPSGAMVVLPLVISGDLLGVLELIGREGDDTFWDNRDLFNTIAEHLALALHSALMYESVERLATIDPLTGIANHRALQDFLLRRVAEAERQQTSLGVIMLDVDHFRSFNEEEGHDAGDQVLKRVAEAIRSCIRAYDHAARYGGEEFTVIMPGADRRQVERVAERIRHEVSAIGYVTRAGRERPVSVSLGLAMYPDTAVEPAHLLKAADTALYQAKRTGRNRVCAYEGPYHETTPAAPTDAEQVRTWLEGGDRDAGEGFLHRVQAYLGYLVREMGLSKRQASLLEALLLAAPRFHRLQQTGPGAAQALLEASSEVRAIAPSLAAIGERYDGAGPLGLEGERIPLLARVLGVLWSLDEDGGLSLVQDPGRFDPEIVALVAEVPEAA